MVGLPGGENRADILKSILQDEDVDDDVDIDELAAMTDGFSGSDLKVSLRSQCMWGLCFCYGA